VRSLKNPALKLAVLFRGTYATDKTKLLSNAMSIVRIRPQMIVVPSVVPNVAKLQQKLRLLNTWLYKYLTVGNNNNATYGISGNPVERTFLYKKLRDKKKQN
jgi:hypothetical protein